MIRPLSVYCPAHDLPAEVACPVPGGACRDRVIAAGTGSPLRALWRSMSGAAVDAEKQRARAEAETRGEPGTAAPLVCDEDVAARGKA